jgi:hypothetical protein
MHVYTSSIMLVDRCRCLRMFVYNIRPQMLLVSLLHVLLHVWNHHVLPRMRRFRMLATSVVIDISAFCICKSTHVCIHICSSTYSSELFTVSIHVSLMFLACVSCGQCVPQQVLEAHSRHYPLDIFT